MSTSQATFAPGVDVLRHSKGHEKLKAASLGLVAHPASMTADGQHTMDALAADGFHVNRAFGPQHGMRGDKQDNMIESEDYLDPYHGIPVVSLYGEHRRPTPEMLAGLDAVLFDLQDIGCRIYTYIATLRYFVEVCGSEGVKLIVLDRPNPAGRPVDGLRLEPGQESFVGVDTLPTRHGLTIGELAAWFNSRVAKPADLEIIRMRGYDPCGAPGFGWPVDQQPWVNPSPNAATLNMARCFPGTVLLEGTTLSEGRGTTRPLELIGAPDLGARAIMEQLYADAPDWSEGVLLRPCSFEPTFQKHEGKLCQGLQIHTDFPGYGHEAFKPWRLIAGLLKACRALSPEQELWRDFPYEYEQGRLPIDVINGGDGLRRWVDDQDASHASLAADLEETAMQWHKEREPFLLYD